MSNGTHRIASGTRFVGALRGSGDLTIEGAAEGSVSIDGALECTASADCSLEVEATTVRIAGAFSGTIEARGRVELLASARVAASVRSPVFVMAEGAVFRGALEMPEPEALAVASAKPASAKPAPTTPTPAKPAFAPKAELMATTVDPSSPVVADGAGAVGDVPAEEQAVPPDATAAEASESDSSTEPAEKAPAKRRTSRGAKS